MVNNKNPAVPYVLPFALFIAILAVQNVIPVPQILRFVLCLTAIAIFSRPVLSWRMVSPIASVLVGIGVFAIWIAPETLIPGYRGFWLFSNFLTGHAVASTTQVQRVDPFFLTTRVLGSVVTIPILEELFWRGWLMRWLIKRDFRAVPLGSYQAEAFWTVAVLFAMEHGAYWEVGLIAGVIYNWWMVRTRSLTDCIVAHAVTNGCLAVWVITQHQWQYWL